MAHKKAEEHARGLLGFSLNGELTTAELAQLHRKSFPGTTFMAIASRLSELAQVELGGLIYERAAINTDLRGAVERGDYAAIEMILTIAVAKQWISKATMDAVMAHLDEISTTFVGQVQKQLAEQQ